LRASLGPERWQTQDGTDKYTTEIVAEEMQFLGVKSLDQRQKIDSISVSKSTVEPATIMVQVDDDSIPF